MKVFFHDDADGYASAAIIVKLIHQNDVVEKDEIRDLIPIDYTVNFDEEWLPTIMKDELIYILDFSIPVESMIELLKITKNIVWIDHHKTTIDKYKDFEGVENIKGYRISDIEGVRVSGCLLSYMYAINYLLSPIVEFVRKSKLDSDNNNLPSSIIPVYNTLFSIGIKSDVVRKYVNDIINWDDDEFTTYNNSIKFIDYFKNTLVPLSIKLIDDRDVWNLVYKDNSIPYNYYFKSEKERILRSMELTLSGKESVRSDISILTDDVHFINECVDIGKTLMRFEEKNALEFAEKYGHEVTLDGHKVYAVNMEVNGSILKEQYDKYPFIISYVFTGVKFKITLYSNPEFNFDVSEIAKRYGGGGHIGAAGFTIGILPWCKPQT